MPKHKGMPWSPSATHLLSRTCEKMSIYLQRTSNLIIMSTFATPLCIPRKCYARILNSRTMGGTCPFRRISSSRRREATSSCSTLLKGHDRAVIRVGHLRGTNPRLNTRVLFQVLEPRIASILQGSHAQCPDMTVTFALPTCASRILARKLLSLV